MKNIGIFAAFLAGSTVLALGGCAEHPLDLPTGTQAYDLMPAQTAAAPPREYTIGPLDRLNVTVFGEPDLSTDQAQVDAAGNLTLPLIGKLNASGKTTDAMSAEIRQRLVKYLVNPRVSVLVLSTASQKVTVEGDVNQAGVYPIQGHTTLLETLAMARGASSVSDEQRVAVFRTINNQRMGAVFNVAAIKSGTAADPEMLGGDVVIVGHSARRGAWHNFLATAPALGFFLPLAFAL